jgi:hypothetical protein
MATAQEPTFKPTPLALFAPKASSRKLQFPLLVPVAEQHPGNAVPFYKEANAKNRELLKEDGFLEVDGKLTAWLEQPLSELPRKDMADFLHRYDEVFARTEAGAHREFADWEHLEALQKMGVGAVLGEDIQRVRSLIRLLAVRIRFYLAEGKIDKALKDLQTGNTMARHAGESPTLIGSLVRAALCNIMLERLEELLTQPNVPNLYWSLGDMPSGVNDLRRAMQAERLSAYGSFPGLLDAATNLDAGPLSAEQVQGCVKALSVIQDSPMQSMLVVLYEARFGLVIAKKHEEAKRALIAAGRPKDKVEAMPHVQVALLHSFLQYDPTLDDVLVTMQQPPWEALPRLRVLLSKNKLKEIEQRDVAPAVPLVSALLPSTEKVYRTQLRLDRRVAAVRCIEALRSYASAHDGKFPASLKDVKDVAIPIDPGTGKDFQYSVKESTATLVGPPLGSETNNKANALWYALTFKK